MDVAAEDSGDHWVQDLKRLWGHKLASNDEAHLNGNLGDLQSLHETFKRDKAENQNAMFSPFVFDKEQESYLQNRKSGLTANNLKCMVQAFKARIQELNENIDEDFISNVKDKIIPEHEGKMNEFLEEAELYLRDMNNKTLHKAFYLENYIYNRVY